MNEGEERAEYGLGDLRATGEKERYVRSEH